MKIKVLFICIHNSARSQMAEALLDDLAGDRFEAHSAGLEPGSLNPLAVEVMREIGLDISGQETKSVFDVFRKGDLFGYTIAVCDAEAAEKCPLFPGVTQRLHWSFPDPSRAEGSWEEKIEQTRGIRDQIKARLEEWVAEVGK